MSTLGETEEPEIDEPESVVDPEVAEAARKPSTRKVFGFREFNGPSEIPEPTIDDEHAQ